MTVHYVFVLHLGSLAWLGSQRPARRLIPQPGMKCLGEVSKLLGKDRGIARQLFCWSNSWGADAPPPAWLRSSPRAFPRQKVLGKGLFQAPSRNSQCLAGSHQVPLLSLISPFQHLQPEILSRDSDSQDSSCFGTDTPRGFQGVSSAVPVYRTLPAGSLQQGIPLAPAPFCREMML